MTEFVYPDMTPELQAYLELQHAHPGYKYAERGAAAPTPESKAAVEAWQAETARLRAGLPEGEPHAHHQAQKVWMCRDETLDGEPVEETSPTGKYRLIVTRHKTGTNSWHYTKGRVARDGEDEEITVVCRNYSSFPFAWVEGHPQGDFLVAGEDYQGQTVVNLTTGIRVDHLPKEASDGAGFCWASIHPNLDGTLLAVCGCYWAAPYETRIVDFSNPMNPPWPVLAVDDADAFGGWTGPESCRIGHRYEVLSLPGHPLDGKKDDDMSGAELEEIIRYTKEHGITADKEWVETIDMHEWKRPDSGKVTP